MPNQTRTFYEKRNKTVDTNSLTSSSSQSSTCNKTKSNLSTSIVSAFRFLDYDEIKSKDNIQQRGSDSSDTSEDECQIIQTVRSEKKFIKPENDEEIMIIDENDDCKIIESSGKGKNGSRSKHSDSTGSHSSSCRRNKNNVPSSMPSTSRFLDHDNLNIRQQKRKLACMTEDCQTIGNVKQKRKQRSESAKNFDDEITIIEETNIERMADDDCKITTNVRQQTFNGQRSNVIALSPSNFSPPRSSSHQKAECNSSQSYSALSAFRVLEYENACMQSNVRPPQKRDLACMVEDNGTIVIKTEKKLKNETVKDFDEEIIIIEDSDSEIVEETDAVLQQTFSVAENNKTELLSLKHLVELEDNVKIVKEETDTSFEAFDATLKNATELHNSDSNRESPDIETFIPEEVAFQQLMINADTTDVLKESEIPHSSAKICSDKNSSSDFNCTSYLQKYISTNFSRCRGNKNLTDIKDEDQQQKRDLACMTDTRNQINESLSCEEKLKEVVKVFDEKFTITGKNDSGIVENETDAFIPSFNNAINYATELQNLEPTANVEMETNNSQKVEKETNVSFDTINVALKNTTELTNLILPVQEQLGENAIELFKEETRISLNEIDVQMNDTTEFREVLSFVKEQIEKVIEIVEKETGTSSDVCNNAENNTAELPKHNNAEKNEIGENFLGTVAEPDTLFQTFNAAMKSPAKSSNLGPTEKYEGDRCQSWSSDDETFTPTYIAHQQRLTTANPKELSVESKIPQIISTNDVKPQHLITANHTALSQEAELPQISSRNNGIITPNNTAKLLEEPSSLFPPLNITMRNSTETYLATIVKCEGDSGPSRSSGNDGFISNDISHQQLLITANQAAVSEESEIPHISSMNLESKPLITEDPTKLSNESEIFQVSSLMNVENVTPANTTMLNSNHIIKEETGENVINIVKEPDSSFHPFNIAMNNLTKSSNFGSTVKYEGSSSQSWSSDNEMSVDPEEVSHESRIFPFSSIYAEEQRLISEHPTNEMEESAVMENPSSDFNYASDLNEIVKNNFKFDSCEIDSCGKFCNIMLTKLNHFKNKTQTAEFILKDIEYELKYIFGSENCASSVKNKALAEGKTLDKGNILPEEEYIHRLLNCDFETDSENNLSTVSLPSQNSSTNSYGIDQLNNIDLSSVNIPPGLDLIFLNKNEE